MGVQEKLVCGRALIFGISKLCHNFAEFPWVKSESLFSLEFLKKGKVI